MHADIGTDLDWLSHVVGPRERALWDKSKARTNPKSDPEALIGLDFLLYRDNKIIEQKS